MKSFKEFLLEVNSSTSNFVLIPAPKTELPTFTQYVRSLSALESALKEHKLSFTIYNIAKLFADHNIALADNTILKLKVDNLWEYREYDRRPGMGQSKGDDNYYDKLKADIEKHGITEPLILNIQRKNDNSVEVFIGEGNHRLVIARELHKQFLDVRIYYRK